MDRDVTTELEHLPGRHKLQTATRCIRDGGILAYPTEAVYGLGCNPWDRAAVRRLLAIKRRPEHKGLILIATDFGQLEPFVEPLDAARMQAVLATWPGPNTWLLPARAGTPGWLRGQHATLAVRVTAHPVADGGRTDAGPAATSQNEIHLMAKGRSHLEWSTRRRTIADVRAGRYQGAVGSRA